MLACVAHSLVVSTARDEKLSNVTWEEIVSSPDQIFHIRPVALWKNRAWTPSLGRLGPDYKVY